LARLFYLSGQNSLDRFFPAALPRAEARIVAPSPFVGEGIEGLATQSVG
jgi:hypothetical protein